MESGTRKEQIKEEQMTMDFACFANAGRTVVCSIFGGNAKPAIRSLILTGCNFRISGTNEFGTTMSLDN
eukprot:15029110-Heterocapsa_arctica.AAC.1